MSRSSIRFVTILLLVSVLLTIHVTGVSASYTQPTALSGHGNGGTWSNRIYRDDYAPAQKVQPVDLGVSEQVVDQAVDLAAVELMRFASSLQAGSNSQVTGVFVSDVMAYSVVQQPSGSAGYVSAQADVVTQFSTAAQFGTVGILAHNFLAGISFFDLSAGEDVYVVYGDGSTAHYVITDIRQFQALQPNSPYSKFIDLETNTTYSSTDVFYEVYGNGGNLVLQTCIAANGIDSWGRLFVIAEKIS